MKMSKNQMKDDSLLSHIKTLIKVNFYHIVNDHFKKKDNMTKKEFNEIFEQAKQKTIKDIKK